MYNVYRYIKCGESIIKEKTLSVFYNKAFSYTILCPIH